MLPSSIAHRSSAHRSGSSSLAKTPDSLHPTLDSFDSTIENFRSGRNEELACDIIYAHIECAGSELYHGDMFT